MSLTILSGNVRMNNTDGFWITYFKHVVSKDILIGSILPKILLGLVAIHFINAIGWLASIDSSTPWLSGNMLDGATNTPLDKLLMGIGLYVFFITFFTFVAMLQSWPQIKRIRLNAIEQAAVAAHAHTISELEKQLEEVRSPRPQPITTIFGKFDFLDKSWPVEDKTDSIRR